MKLDDGKVGSFDGDEGDFFGSEVVAGKDVIVRFHWDKGNPKAPIYSRAFSVDAGRTWQWNWYSNFSPREHLLTTPGSRTHTHRSAKQAREVTLIRETTRECNLEQR
jgi:hypothetical protein